MVAYIALLMAVCNLFLTAFILGRLWRPAGTAEQTTTPPDDANEQERRAREKIQEGMDSIMGYEVSRGFMGDE